VLGKVESLGATAEATADVDPFTSESDAFHRQFSMPLQERLVLGMEWEL
jgi:hypothetical protein